MKAPTAAKETLRQFVASLRRRKRTLAVAAIIVGVLWVAGCATIYSNMRKPPDQFGHFMTRIPAPIAFLAFPFETMWMSARRGTLNPGDVAPDFTLSKVDHTGEVRLAEINQDKPVVLIFGSYT